MPAESARNRPRLSGGPALPSPTQRSWSERYGERHQLVRIVDFPAGIVAPRKVRLYRRQDHYVLQWWDPDAKRNLSDRVDGDLVAAIARARQIEERVSNFRSSGQGCRRMGHQDLVEKFLQDMARRADAGEVDSATAKRYASALDHYSVFVQQVEIGKSFPHASGVNRDFQLRFAAFLSQRVIASNGHPNTLQRPMKKPGFVEDAVRAMFQWAADRDRGGLLPDGFRNPFLGASRQRRTPPHDPVGMPDISMEMAAQFLEVCDAYQLALFAPIIFFGLRAAEPACLFREHLHDRWLQVPCIPELAITTKGRRNKTLPVPPILETLWTHDSKGATSGLLYLRRGVLEDREKAPLRNSSLATLIEEFRCRCLRHRSIDAAQKKRARDQLLKEAGGLAYDQIEAEFHRVAGKLGWPPRATVKDFRHLFSTSLENAGVPLYFRQYLMGQAHSKAPITTYTHLAAEQVRKHYDRAVDEEFGPVVKALQKRMTEVGWLNSEITETR